MRTIRQHLTYPRIAATLAAFLAAGAGAWAAASSTSPSIHACYKKRGGALRIAARCRRGEAALSWSRVAPTGAKGATGAKGVTGARGPGGKRGATGAQGAKGETGAAGQVRAFATITPGSPATIKAGAHGVVSAKTSGGITCVFLEASIAVASTSPVVTSKVEDVTFAASPGSCREGTTEGIQVKGYGPGGVANTTETFSIVVP